LAGVFVFAASAWALYAARKNAICLLLILLSAASSGAAVFSLRDRTYEANKLHRDRTEGYLDVVGTLVGSPGREPGRDILTLRVDSIRAGGPVRTVRGNLRLTVPFDPSVRGRLRLHSGDRVRAAAEFSSGGSFNNFGGFSYDRFLKSRDIHRRAFTKSSLLVEKAADGPAMSPRNLISRLRCALQDNLESFFPAPGTAGLSPEGAALEALLLGEDGRLDPRTVLSLQETGLYHLFAISGSHIAIVTFLLFGLLRLFRLRRAPANLVLIALLIFYTLLVEGSPSVLRASFMTLAYLVGRLLWKDVRILNTISFSAFVLLLANPFDVFDAGFQLTFAATLAIILFAPRIIQRLPRLPLKAGELTALSLSAILGVLPIIACHFNRITFSSLVLNYAAAPLVGLILGLGYAFLPISAASSVLGTLLASGLKFLVMVFFRLSHVLDGLPALSYRTPTPPGWVIAGYYLFLGLLLLGRRFKGQRLIVTAGFAAFLVTIATYPFSPASRGLTVTMLDVGQGDSILVEFPGRKRMLIDGGGFTDSAFDVGERVVSPALWRRGIRQIDIMVLTHPHPDHLNGLVAVARNFRIGEFWEAYPPPPSETGAYCDLGDALRPEVLRRRVFRGYARRIGSAAVSVLHPGAEDGPSTPASENDLSLVLRISFGGTAVLFTGDIEARAEREILERGAEVSCAVLKSPPPRQQHLELRTVPRARPARNRPHLGRPGEPLRLPRRTRPRPVPEGGIPGLPDGRRRRGRGLDRRSGDPRPDGLRNFHFALTGPTKLRIMSARERGPCSSGKTGHLRCSRSFSSACCIPRA